MTSPLWRKLLVLVAVLVCGTASSCAAITDAGTVSVLASWTGAEETAFRKVLAVFTDRTHIRVDYQGTRALDQVLAADVQRGTAPDVAMLPNPGSLAAYADHGLLRLDFLEHEVGKSYPAAWSGLQHAGKATLYAVAVKADLKSAIWFRPARLPGALPATWQQLLDRTRAVTASGGTPWCLGLAAPPTSGWPGTDWIEDLLLHSAGPEVYRRWAAGTLSWTSPQVRQAWLDWGTLVVHPGGVSGGPSSALLTDFGDAGRPLFADPPGCLLEHQGSFVMSTYAALGKVAGRDYDLLPFPGPRVSEVSADLAGMFHDTAGARRLLEFLISPEAQEIWVRNGVATVFSARADVPLTAYGDATKQEVARMLTVDPKVCFDASDLMPAAMSGAFYRAVLEFVNDPGQLDVLLGRLEDTRRGIPVADWLDVPCGQ
ncbi:extracellular solute-binding protein [Amycolatopsis rhabdoformis]|uniref:Extracellular solute-binding protein n=1 Tax=Amycolatopsis rhabdoformis TaxID=1448059 RepID=A0ABZ1IIF3_9PSEU|nr:extracellular solute-binding protein [Amycolatopsis rhabdoformis]WSE34027.1 extracellular solute-binding protein [Amycolatopsis rhabdoformis]